MNSCYINSTFAIHPSDIGLANTAFGTTEPDYKNIIKDANQRRRMSRVVKMGVAAALLCMEQYEDKAIDTILTATGLGCLTDTEKFIDSLIDNEERLLNPTPFIQSTFNVVGSQIALLTGNHCYNNTYTHRALSFECALLDAMMCINEDAQNVLVGASDEKTPNSHRIMKRLGMFQDHHHGEGSQFFILSKQKTDQSLAEIMGVKTFVGEKREKEIINNIKSFLADKNLAANNINLFLSGESIHTEIGGKLFPQAKVQTFKDICGEYHTASAFALWQVFSDKQDTLLNVGDTALIYNQFQGINHSLILVKTC